MRARTTRLARTALILIAVSLTTQTTKAEVVAVGCGPRELSEWTDTLLVYIGNPLAPGDGTFLVNNGTQFSKGGNYQVAGSTGNQRWVKVDGAGSKLTNGGILLGRPTAHVSGLAELEVTNGGSVVSSRLIYAHPRSADGQIGGVIRMENGSITTPLLCVASGDLKGNGTIQTNGLMSDKDLKFYSSASLNQSLNYSDAHGNTVVVNLDLSNPSKNTDLGVGYGNASSLFIGNGVKLASRCGVIGYNGTQGTALIDWGGTHWDVEDKISLDGRATIRYGGQVSSDSFIVESQRGKSELIVKGGDARLNTRELTIIAGRYSGASYSTNEMVISNGGVVNCDVAEVTGNYIGESMARVDGKDAAWNIQKSLTIGNNNETYQHGQAFLEIANGGKVTVGESLLIRRGATVSIEVSNNQMLWVGRRFTNFGTLRLTAGADLAAGTYRPIWAPSGIGNYFGTFQVFGGTWNDSTRQFTVGDSQVGQTGQDNIINLADTMRLLLEDQASGLSIGAAFGAQEVPTEVTFTATATDEAAMSGLSLQLTNDEDVLSSFDFEVAGLADGEEVLLSFELDGDFDAENLSVWHFDGTTWTEYDASDLIVKDGWAHFTVDGFSSYAISAVPEPATLSILAIASLAIIRRRKNVA